MIAYLQEQSCVLHKAGIFAYPGVMDGLESDTDLVRALVEWAGERPATIAKKAGLANTTLNRPFRGTAGSRISQPTLDKLRAAYPAFPQFVDRPKPNATIVPMEGASMERMRDNLPVYGTALGSARWVDSEAIEQTTLNKGEVVQYAKRPVLLNGRADAYGLYVQGSSMYPAHPDGSMVVVAPNMPLRVGDDVVVYLRPDDPAEDDGRAARAVLLKRLVKRNASYIELEQFQPAMVFRVEAHEVVRIDRVLTLTEMLT